MKLLPNIQLPLEHPFIHNKYTQWYYNIISNAQTRTISKCEYTERHHIIPESFYINRSRRGCQGTLVGEPNNPCNIINLSAREHFLVHRLLTKMTTGLLKKKMVHAIWHMIHHSTNVRNFQINSISYQVVRENLSKIMSNREVSESTRNKLRNANLGKKYTEEQKQSFKGKGAGRRESIATRELKRVIAQNRPPMTEDVKNKIRKARSRQKSPNKDRMIITNGHQNQFIDRSSMIPDGWYPGTFKKGIKLDTMCVNNGCINKMIPRDANIPYGWSAGRIKSK